MELSELTDVLSRQEGVVSRRQLLAAGAARHDIARWVRRRELAGVHPGVYVTHTGTPTIGQRRWAAVLALEPAALCLGSALRDDAEPVEVAVDATRRVTAPHGVVVRRVRGLAGRVRWNASPPRIRVEEAVLDLVARAADDLEAVRVLTDAVGDRLTTAARLGEVLEARPRMPRRRWLRQVLDDVASGACSVLEHAYLTRVERAHGLPRATRQVVRLTPSGTERRDVEYVELGVVVELDGRGHHAGWDASGRDADRDLDDAASDRVVVRLRYAQVLGRPCRTAGRLARVMQRRGWTGRPVRCGPDCRLP